MLSVERFPPNFKFTKNNRNDTKPSAQHVETVSPPTITTDQYDHLLQLLNANNISPSTIPNQVNVSITDGAMANEGKKFSFAKFASNVYKSKEFLQPHYSWIIDSGATDHMCSNSSLFLFMNKLSQPISIGLLDGHTASVTYIGDIQIHSNLILHGVFYLTSFKIQFNVNYQVHFIASNF